MTTDIKLLVSNFINFVFTGNPGEVLVVGIALLLSASLIEHATRLARDALRLVGIIIIVIALLRFLGVPLQPPTLPF